ncbi:MAG: AAA family ATPase [Mongoliibacter sp.]|uniref:ATP-binding protein n=1 Tax=Mongoliibacter sp. TaxID=2022438 RepID=UPI0012F093C1|nr:AAA family ATPase [Mongoliibacter sp.]TVP49998.1 MAG: AAA family ATPase [Mongoliibacter sp.]
MEDLNQKSKLIVSSTSLKMIRSKYDEIDWDSRLVGILGARGTGKSTLVLQYLKKAYGLSDRAAYWSLDDIYFSNHSLIETIESFYHFGGRFLVLDEVHKYPTWARELKNAYDFYKELKVVFTGSSVIDMLKLDVDLSRRAVLYDLTGLSFREYLNFTKNIQLPIFQLNEIISNHVDIANSILEKINPLAEFDDYIKFGYYPFFMEGTKTYHLRIEQIIRMTIETELQFIEGMDIHKTKRIHQLLGLIAQSVPFKPNVAKLSEKIGIHRNTLTTYLHYLEKAKIINSLFAEGKSTSILQKPDKVYLENTNISYALAGANLDIGNLRGTFFYSQVAERHQLSLPKNGDFLLDDKLTIEVGGKNKTDFQIKGESNSFLAIADLPIGSFNRIPLWLFGFIR